MISRRSIAYGRSKGILQTAWLSTEGGASGEIESLVVSARGCRCRYGWPGDRHASCRGGRRVPTGRGGPTETRLILIDVARTRFRRLSSRSNAHHAEQDRARNLESLCTGFHRIWSFSNLQQSPRTRVPETDMCLYRNLNPERVLGYAAVHNTAFVGHRF